MQARSQGLQQENTGPQSADNGGAGTRPTPSAAQQLAKSGPKETAVVAYQKARDLKESDRQQQRKYDAKKAQNRRDSYLQQWRLDHPGQEPPDDLDIPGEVRELRAKAEDGNEDAARSFEALRKRRRATYARKHVLKKGARQFVAYDPDSPSGNNVGSESDDEECGESGDEEADDSSPQHPGELPPWPMSPPKRSSADIVKNLRIAAEGGSDDAARELKLLDQRTEDRRVKQRAYRLRRAEEKEQAERHGVPDGEEQRLPVGQGLQSIFASAATSIRNGEPARQLGSMGPESSDRMSLSGPAAQTQQGVIPTERTIPLPPGEMLGETRRIDGVVYQWNGFRWKRTVVVLPSSYA